MIVGNTLAKLCVFNYASFSLLKTNIMLVLHEMFEILFYNYFYHTQICFRTTCSLNSLKKNKNNGELHPSKLHRIS